MELRGEERQSISLSFTPVGFSAASFHFIMDLWSKKVPGIITQVLLILIGSHWATAGGEYSQIFNLW